LNLGKQGKAILALHLNEEHGENKERERERGGSLKKNVRE